MSKLPLKSENPDGLHFRYIISKVSGEPIDENAEYFILRLDKYGSDPKHISACRKAILTYAEEIREHLPKLADDLIERYGVKKYERGTILSENQEFIDLIDIIARHSDEEIEKKLGYKSLSFIQEIGKTPEENWKPRMNIKAENDEETNIDGESEILEKVKEIVIKLKNK